MVSSARPAVSSSTLSERRIRVQPSIALSGERNSWETWEDKLDRKQIVDHAVDEAERILRDHQVPPLEPLALCPSNLPVQLTSFIGREREMAEVTRLIADKSSNEPSRIRLLTLTGPGGTGKTRLALQVATGLVDRFPDGVWLVELAALSDLSLVPQTVATAMGFLNTAGGPPLEPLTLVTA